MFENEDFDFLYNKYMRQDLKILKTMSNIRQKISKYYERIDIINKEIFEIQNRIDIVHKELSKLEVDLKVKSINDMINELEQQIQKCKYSLSINSIANNIIAKKNDEERLEKLNQQIQECQNDLMILHEIIESNPEKK